ncbi:MAG: hypothetical protein KAU44_03670 [Candidatus Marinimicrobia bacterium]|nr:hypothetical protein [Candidatus Neomarinimicrobiota bacterium]
MNKKLKINFHALVGMGVTFMVAGVVFMFAINTILGISLVAVGFGNMTIGLSQGKKQG